MDRLSDYSYALPAELIAQRPLEDRAASKLLWLHLADECLTHHAFREATTILRPGDLLVVNDTKVTARRLFGERPTGGKVELLLLREIETSVYEALAKPAKRLRPGEAISFPRGIQGNVLEALQDGRRIVRFEARGDLTRLLEEASFVPLPPYIHEPLSDEQRYQTVYASQGGSAAAPTAGLHFTPEVLAELERVGVDIARITLDISMDTFRPVASEDVEDHVMHGEACTIAEETAAAVAACRGRVIAVGTTTVRSLESMAVDKRRILPGRKLSNLFIRPGYSFQVVDGMFTNFHMPRTTMLMLVSALAGRERIIAAYHEAIRHRYRFLSFGDSMLIL